MPKLNVDEVVTQQHVRAFVTYGPPQPGNSALYYGIRGQYWWADGIENPVQGDISPINTGDPLRRKRYKRIGRMVEAPDLGSYALKLAHKHGTLPRAFGDLAGCPITTHLSAGRCKNPSDLNRGYEDWLYILANGEATDRSPGDMTGQDSDDLLMTELSITTAEQYGVGPLQFITRAATEINAEVVDVVFAPPRDCDGCDPGSKRIYAITKAIGGSPTNQAEIIWSVDGGLTYSQGNITGLGATVNPTAIEVAGEILIVLCNQSNCLFWAAIDPYTGAPGTWSTVTAGFATGGNPNDLYVAAPNDIYIVGNGGYIYRSRDITAGVTVISAGTITTQPLQRIRGDGLETLVAVGNLGVVLYSTDLGTSWSLTVAGSPTSATLFAVEVKSDTHWWVGAGNGNLYYTLNQGGSWVHDTEAAPSATVITDIVFPTDHVGYVAYQVAGPSARLASTVDGGDTWATGPARIIGTFPTFRSANRIAVPRSGAPQVDANSVILGGLDGAGTGGVLYVAQANQL